MQSRQSNTSILQVLTIIDSSYHDLKDIQETSFLDIKGKRKADDKPVEFTERMTIHLPFIGLSLIDSSPQASLSVSSILNSKYLLIIFLILSSPKTLEIYFLCKDFKFSFVGIDICLCKGYCNSFDAKYG